ncbi:uridine kinase [Arthrobacter tumbae]|uniref:uridine kinase n=1 Tax=Arthrobacter tumbae TaxID=163874 RepID=UPI001EF856BB|nr:uridine kinase [Arthrobacter tumbae]
MFADALAEHMGAAGKHVIRVGLDNFHQPREIRYQRGRSSPEGFWLDSYDYKRLHAFVLDPLFNHGLGWFRPASHDLESDQLIEPPAQLAPVGSIVIVDGMFLNRDETRNSWDYSVFLDVPFRVTAERMSERDGSPADPSHPAMRRYVGGQKLYMAECDPAARATLVLDNTDPQKPTVISPGEASYRRTIPSRTEP